jgi:ribosomal protein S18 acetylase RimI-like enzyme
VTPTSPPVRTTAYAVRSAAPDDARGIAAVHVRSWHEAYTGKVPQTLLEQMDLDRRAGEWHRHLVGEAPPGAEPLGTTWVAVAQRTVVGFATSGPARDPDRTRDDAELYALYLLEAHHGSGAADALLAASLGRRPASLWVLDDNPRARAFYARHGFEPDGARRDDARWGEPLREVRLVRDAA